MAGEDNAAENALEEQLPSSPHNLQTDISKWSVPKKPTSSAEIDKAEMEMKLRRFVLELVQPTIRKTTHLEHVFSEMQTTVRGIEDQLHELHQMAQKVEQQVLLVESFREELGRWDNERRQFHAEAQEAISTQRADLDAFRYQLERQDSSIHSVQRTVDRVVGELARVQEGTEAMRQHLEQRLLQTTKLLNSSKADLEVKLVALETRFNRAQDELWGEETGLAKVISDLRNTDRVVRELEEGLKDMQCSKATVMQVQGVQMEVNKLISEANATISVLKHSVDTNLNDLKAHFKTATNTVAAHNAVMLQEVRQSYREELDQSAKTRGEVMEFIQAAQQDVKRLEETQKQQNARTEEALRKMDNEVADVGRGRRRDKNNADVETMTMKEQLNNIHGTSQEVAKSLEHLSSVIWMVVQSEVAASALDIQDDTDRGKVALMGYRDNKANTAAAARARGKISNPNPQGAEDMASGPVISVDHRCLSCSGQAQTVLSGFKMACLEYAPGPVNFARKTWHRADLLDWRNKLLTQAHEALQSGPIEFHREDHLAAAGAGGGQPQPPSRLAGGSIVRREASPGSSPGGGSAAVTAGCGSGGGLGPEGDSGVGGGAGGGGPERPASRASSSQSGRGSSMGVIKMPPLTSRTHVVR